jgi:hypothetical protein
MRDADLRQAVRLALEDEHSRDAETLIVEEMGIWAGSVRIDLAVINGEMHGYELKSARDTLQRLPSQAELYSQVFDRVTLVCAEKHVGAAQSLVPEWWGVSTAALSREGEPPRVTHVRSAEENPTPNALQVARLLWRTEAMNVLTRYGLARGYRTKPHEAIANRIATELSVSILKGEVRSALKRRRQSGQPVCNQLDVSVDSDRHPSLAAT